MSSYKSLKREPDRIDRIVSYGVIVAVCALIAVVFAVNGYHLVKQEPWKAKPAIEKQGNENRPSGTNRTASTFI